MTVKISTRASFYDFAAKMNQGEPFKTHGALHGTDHPHPGDCGRLPTEYRESFRHADYAVYSYQTPIAWYFEDAGWTVPDEKYSPTTTAHQTKIRAAVSVIEGK